MIDDCILIIPACDTTNAGFVSNSIQRCGYATREIPIASARGIRDRDDTTVVIIGQHSLSRRSLMDVFGELGAIRPFGLFLHEDLLDDEIIGRCSDFAAWPLSQVELNLRLRRLTADARAVEPVALDADALERIEVNLIGASSAFTRVLRRLRRFAESEANVLIQGETGTGKELAARAVHYLSRRKGHPFIPVNCGALPETLVENELFGHARGAYTDARQSQDGLIAQAEGGALFLDEVEALSPKSQVTLLRFLEDRQYKPLGGKGPIDADVRVIAASNQALDALVTRSHFRADLYYRLNILPVTLPALRERGDDIRLLAEHFMQVFRGEYRSPGKRLHADTLAWMLRYDWLGNIRQLENLLHREFLLADGDVVRIECPDADGIDADGEGAGRNVKRLAGLRFKEAKASAVRDFERDYLCALLAAAGGNVSEAARRAGKERRALGKLLCKHGINRQLYCDSG